MSTGADETEIIGTVNAADAFLADHHYMDWYGLDEATQQMILDWMTLLGQWNAGEFGPGRCDDVYIND